MIVHKQSKSILLRIKPEHQSFLKKLMPGRVRDITYGKYNVAVRHGIDETKILNNIGIQAPSPILHHYNWPGKYQPWSHQRYTAALLTLHKRVFVLNEAGTAKTASALWAADYLMRLKVIRKVLVVAKLSTLDCVWMNELFAVLMHRTASLVYGTRSKRIDRLALDVDFYVINHEGVSVVLPQLMARDDIDLIILDEASDYRNSQTDKYKKLQKLLKPMTRLWLMTATPCPNEPTDAWALARLVNPESVPKFFGSFRRQLMTEVREHKWVAREGAYEEAFKVMQPAVRYIKNECIDLPPVVTEERICELSKDQTRAISDMRNKQLMTASTGEKISAVNAADKINKIRQILCGVIKDTATGEYRSLDYRKRLSVLLDCIQEANAKVIVVIPFKGILNALKKDVGKYYTCAAINGDVSSKQRNKIITEFKELDDPHVLLCHPKVMAHGLNLTEADTLIFYAPIYSNDEALQVVERFNRAGQTRKMTIIRMIGHWLERDIYESKDAQQQGQEKILQLYRKVFLEENV